MNLNIATVRRTQLVGTFGVGSMYPAQDQSLMIQGLDYWNPRACRSITEPRLARSLGIAQLKEPPSGSDDGDVPVVRFPEYYFCPDCRRLDRIRNFDSMDRTPRCQDCGCAIVPSRFVTCCVNGHIDDFPYFAWIHRSSSGGWSEGKHRLKLRTRGQSSALSDVVVECTCGASRSMEGAFGASALKGIASCSGRRPWLGDREEPRCTETPRTFQRGSSNTWFGQVLSSISIPPWSDVYEKLEKHREVLQGLPEESLRTIFAKDFWIPEGSGLTVDMLVSLFQGVSEGAPPPTTADMRNEEFQALMAGHPEASPTDQFVCTKVDMDDAEIGDFVAQVRNVSRLREVRALVGFSRVAPEKKICCLSKTPRDWLPAIEVFGEGVFVELSTPRFDEWVNDQFALGRAATIANAATRSMHPVSVNAKLLLLHSFSHALMNELSLDAGYPVASLRERLYTQPGQAGILIYTSTSDSAGSLGGLSSQSEASKLDSIIRAAVTRASWCSTDPICIESQGSGVENLNLAACHACLLLPETSCELRNTLLDRAMLVGTPDHETEGFFSSLI